MIVSIIDYYCLFYANNDFYISYDAIIYSVTVCLGLIWIIFLLSKILFKNAFTSEKWENVFIFIVGFPTFIQVLYGSVLCFYSWGTSSDAFPTLLYYYDCFLDLQGCFFELLLVFLIIYLISFVTRLIRHKQKKAVEFVKNE